LMSVTRRPIADRSRRSCRTIVSAGGTGRPRRPPHAAVHPLTLREEPLGNGETQAGRRARHEHASHTR
jgi:hypothetical protein